MCSTCSSAFTSPQWHAAEYIYRDGDLTAALHICQKGKVAIVRPDSIIEDMISDGCHFGLQSLLSSDPRPNNAIALSNCDILTISSHLVSSCMAQCPSSAARVRQNVTSLCAPWSLCSLCRLHACQLVCCLCCLCDLCRKFWHLCLLQCSRRAMRTSPHWISFDQSRHTLCQSTRRGRLTSAQGQRNQCLDHAALRVRNQPHT